MEQKQVDEPVVETQAVDGDDEARPGPDPTGMFAGETVEDRREERAVRRVLEAGEPRTRGAWKESGRVPSAGPSDPATSVGDVALPIIAALAIVLIGAGALLRRGRRPETP